MPPKIKARNAPNQHDKRHESGLAAPGKRVTKQRSTGQLNGHANGKPSPSTSPIPPPLPSTGLNQGFRFSRTSESADVVVSSGDSPAPSARDHAHSPEGTPRGRIPSDTSMDEVGPHGEMGEGGQHVHDLPSPAVNVDVQQSSVNRPNLRPSPSSSVSTMSTISTILTNYPLRDAISILILLLSLPPTLVLVIQTLFASLTFVPPTAGLSLSTLPNIKEMFNSAGLGYPALATILIVDLIFWICWLPVWTPLQGVFLDLSQAVIAVSLSGAASTNGRPTYSIATTSVIVCVVHVLRYRAIHLTALDYLRSVIHKSGVGLPLDVSSFATNYFLSPPAERGWTHTVIRTVLGIHIVSQGVTTCIRRSLVKANEQNASNVPAITKTDAEAAAGLEPRSNSASLEAGQHAVSAPSSDGRSPGPSPAHRDSKASRESSSKKKRKQANQVRSQQPLWAAIASTKVTFIKEMEQRDAADDAREAANMDSTNNNTSSSTTINTTNTNTNTDRLWICEVRDTEIFFSVELSPQSTVEMVDDAEEGSGVGAGIDKTKPFYVCINGAAWSSTKIALKSDGEDASSRKIERYEGEIFGLAPLSSYLCEIVSITSKKALCEASIITQPAPSAEQTVSSSSSQPPPQTLRPSSPITTLRQSIQSAEARLNETRNRGKKSKKDHRAIHSDIKREIQTLRSKLDTSGGTDDKQERRLNQISQHKNQAEEAAAELKEQIDALGEVPMAEMNEYESQRRTWQTAVNEKSAAQRGLEDAKADAERELSALKSEICQTESRHEKLQAKQTQRLQEMEKLVSKQHADQSARQERARAQKSREAEEQQYRFVIANLDAEADALQHKAQAVYREIAALQSWPDSAAAAHQQFLQQQLQMQQQQPPPAYPGYSSPPTPENRSASASGTPAQANGFPVFTPQHQQQQQGPPFNVSPFTAASAIAPPPPPHHHQQQHPGAPPASRQRSSSMLSQYSGFTDDTDDDNPNPNVNQRGQSFYTSNNLPPTSSASNAPAYASWTPTVAHALLNNNNSNSSATDDRAFMANNSEGSGSLSGSAGSNSPRPDAKVFVPGAGVGVGGAGFGLREKGPLGSPPLRMESSSSPPPPPPQPHSSGGGRGK